MALDLQPLSSASRILFAVELAPLQGQRFQPTGFPNLGPALYSTAIGQSLLLESAQSMANRLEATCWDATKQDLVGDLLGLSHVRVTRKGEFLTDTVLESHRINSPYLLEGRDKKFADLLKKQLSTFEACPIDRAKLAATLLRFDVGSLLHGAFLAKKELAGGRLRIPRAMSAFIEADGVQVAASGGVKNDHVNPSGAAKDGFGNVPFARDEFTAQRITFFANIDLAQIRGYGLGEATTKMLTLLALWKLRTLLDGDLRLRTACDLEPKSRNIVASRPEGFALPSKQELAPALRQAIEACKDKMVVTTTTFEDELSRGRGDDEGEGEAGE
ncbi:MAG: type I-U CRISPR-associated protein Cas7 [Planctomycetes bacterium]|nr:type I-U CRISPR-associated protein Cas7 [Planctomycetota bacterium]MCC7065156.1 type I-U CRISPR-associated protein Cas7 [Planctomycetota bacterium]